MVKVEEEVFIPDPSWLTTWATKFDTWANEIDLLWLKVDLSKISPGQLDAGVALLARWDVVRDDLKIAFTYLYKHFKIIAEELRWVAGIYTSTNDLNHEDAERLRLLVDRLGPDAARVLPPPDYYPPGYAPPPPSESPMPTDEEATTTQPSKQPKKS